MNNGWDPALEYSQILCRGVDLLRSEGAFYPVLVAESYGGWLHSHPDQDLILLRNGNQNLSKNMIAYSWNIPKHYEFLIFAVQLTRVYSLRACESLTHPKSGHLLRPVASIVLVLRYSTGLICRDCRELSLGPRPIFLVPLQERKQWSSTVMWLRDDLDILRWERPVVINSPADKQLWIITLPS